MHCQKSVFFNVLKKSRAIKYALMNAAYICER